MQIFCSGVCLAQLLFTFFWGTGSLTEPESYQVSFVRQASLWALGIYLFRSHRHVPPQMEFHLHMGGLNSLCLCGRLSHIPSFQPEDVKIKRNIFGEAENNNTFC